MCTQGSQKIQHHLGAQCKISLMKSDIHYSFIPFGNNGFVENTFLQKKKKKVDTNKEVHSAVQLPGKDLVTF